MVHHYHDDPKAWRAWAVHAREACWYESLPPAAEGRVNRVEKNPPDSEPRSGEKDEMARRAHSFPAVENYGQGHRPCHQVYQGRQAHPREHVSGVVVRQSRTSISSAGEAELCQEGFLSS